MLLLALLGARLHDENKPRWPCWRMRPHVEQGCLIPGDAMPGQPAPS